MATAHSLRIVNDLHQLGDYCSVALCIDENDYEFRVSISKSYGHAYAPVDNILLSLSNCVALEYYTGIIDETIAGDKSERTINIKTNIFADVSSDMGIVYIHAGREVKEKDDESVSVNNMVMLNISEWEQLKFALREIFPTEIPNYTSVLMCNNISDHSNLMAYLQCGDCNPDYNIFDSFDL